MSDERACITEIHQVGVHLVDCTNVIERECAEKALTQKSVALTYAMAMRSEAAGADKPDWKRINAAILARWPKGLTRVKERAWAIYQGRIQP